MKLSKPRPYHNPNNLMISYIISIFDGLRQYDRFLVNNEIVYFEVGHYDIIYVSNKFKL